MVNALLAAALLSLGMAASQEEPRFPAMTTISFAPAKGAEQGEEEAEAPQQATPDRATPDEAPQPVAVQAVLPAAPTAHTPPPLIPATMRAAQPEAASAPASGATAVQPPGSSQSSSASAAAAAAPARRGTADGLDVRAPSGDGRSYAARIRSWLHAHKIYPRRAKMRREEGVVQVRFTIDRSGALLTGAIVRGSGNGTLDEEAMATLRRSSPFPPAPQAVTGERIEFTVPIEFMLST